MNKEQEFTLDEIIEHSFDFSDYPETEKQDLIAETSGMIMEAAVLRSLDEGGAELQEKFSEFLKTEPDEDAMAKFIADNFTNFAHVIADEIEVFKNGGKKETEKTDSAE